MKHKIAAIILIFIFCLLAISSMLQKSGTCDEIAHHIPVGYLLLTKWDFKMDTSQPPLPRYISALPLKLFMQLNIPQKRSDWRIEDRSSFGRDFFFKYNENPRKILFFSRTMVAIIALLCGLLLFIWTKKLYGQNCALLALFFYSLSPNILAHARLATTDMITTFFMLLCFYVFWLFIKKHSIKHAILVGICLGIAQLSKFTLILLYPLFLVLSGLKLIGMESEEKKIFVKYILISFVISILILWAGYRFDLDPILKNAMRVEEKLVIAYNLFSRLFPQSGNLSQAVDIILLRTPCPLGAWILGILGFLRHGYEGHGQFFCGNWTSHGNPLYFIVAFLIKTPIPAIVLFFAGLTIGIRKKLRYKEWFLAFPVALLFTIASFSKLQLGLRYILPIYPFIFIIISKASNHLLKERLPIKIIAITLLIWYAVSSLSIYPDYLSYFNESIGGPDNGYKYLRDSNIDWGQDLPSLSAYLKNNKIDEVVLEYFGQDDPHFYGINFSNFSLDDYNNPSNKVYAISAHYLEHARWTKEYNPTQRAGRSIFIYDFRRGK